MNLQHRPARLAALLALLAAALPTQAQNPIPFSGGRSKLVAEGGGPGDRFGSSLALHGGLVAIGSPGADVSGDDSGAVHVFSAFTGAQLAQLVPNDGAAGDGFGRAVALYGRLALVGAPGDDDHGAGSGSAYLFDARTGVQLAKLLPGDGAAGDEFGCAVDVDGEVVVVGAKRSDAQGNDSGAVYVFDATSAAEVHKLLPGNGAAIATFGEAVGVSGGIVAVGAHGVSAAGPLSGAAYLFDAQSGSELFQLLPDDGATNDFFGASIAIDDGVVVVGASYKSHGGKHSGVAYLFDAGTGAQVAKLVPHDPAPFDRFGNAVAVGGGRVVVGSFHDTENGFASGSAYVFDLDGNPTEKLLAPDGAAGDDFGWAVAAGRVRLAVGAVGDADLGRDSGSAYLFD